MRAAVVNRLEHLGFWLDEEANATRSRDPRVISRAASPVTVLVVPTNEELAMARETKAAIGVESPTLLMWPSRSANPATTLPLKPANDPLPELVEGRARRSPGPCSGRCSRVRRS